jgi:hypothetical protein
VPKAVSYAHGSGGNQDQTRPRSETSANDDEVKHSMEKGSEEVAAKQNKAQGKETEIRADAMASSQQQSNQTVRFGKSDPSVSLGSVQKGDSKTIAPRTTPSPHWCSLGLMPSQRRRIQRLSAQKLREEAAKKERDEHFNAIRSVIPMK